jgi:hypothetical protein
MICVNFSASIGNGKGLEWSDVISFYRVAKELRNLTI